MTDNDVLVAGETLVDFVPGEAAPLADVETFSRRAGGAPANVAVALARLDRPPLFWTRVGADPFGEFLAARLREEGVPQQLVERDPEASTTLAFVSHAGGDPNFSFYRDGTADARLSPERVPADAVDAADWVHVGGVSLATEPARSATLELLERAGNAGCVTSFDPNVRPELWANDAELATVCGWAVEATNVLVATPAEVRALGLAEEPPAASLGSSDAVRDAAGDAAGNEESEPLALARAATEHGPHTVVLTLGADGAVAVATAEAPWSGASGSAATGSECATQRPGFAVDVEDPTGAGDAFAAGLIDALRSECGFEDAVAFANAVGALATTERGATTALPARADALALLEGAD